MPTPSESSSGFSVDAKQLGALITASAGAESTFESVESTAKNAGLPNPLWPAFAAGAESAYGSAQPLVAGAAGDLTALLAAVGKSLRTVLDHYDMAESASTIPSPAAAPGTPIAGTATLATTVAADARAYHWMPLEAAGMGDAILGGLTLEMVRAELGVLRGVAKEVGPAGMVVGVALAIMALPNIRHPEPFSETQGIWRSLAQLVQAAHDRLSACLPLSGWHGPAAKAFQSFLTGEALPALAGFAALATALADVLGQIAEILEGWLWGLLLMAGGTAVTLMVCAGLGFAAPGLGLAAATAFGTGLTALVSYTITKLDSLADTVHHQVIPDADKLRSSVSTSATRLAGNRLLNDFTAEHVGDPGGWSPAE